MLFKLSLSNIRKSLRDYAIYFFTLIIGVAVFYVFNAIGGQAAMMRVTNSQYDFIQALATAISVTSVFVAGVLGLLIVYASRFLMKRRSKEFALYMMLGMSKRKISAILLIETIIIGIGSLFIGLLLGIGLSQLMSALVANLFEADMTAYKFTVSGDAIIKTIVYFAVMYLVVMIFNSFVVTKMKLINLMQSGKKSEQVKLKNPVLCVIIFLIAVVMLCYAYYQVGWHSATIEAKVMTKYIIMGIVSTFLIFWSVSGMLLRVMMSMKNVYHRDLNAFTFRQLSSKVNTMVFSMTVICLMLFITICTLASAFSIRNSMNANINGLCPADYYLETDYNENNPKIYDSISELCNKNGYNITKDFDSYTEIKLYSFPDITWETELGDYGEKLKEVFPYMSLDIPETFVKLSEYNALMDLYGREQLTMNDDEYIVICDFTKLRESRDETLSKGREINVLGNTLKSKYDDCLDGFITISTEHANMGIYIVPDAVLAEADNNADVFIGNYPPENKEDTEKIVHDRFDMVQRKVSEKFSISYWYTTKIELVATSVGLGAIVTFLGLYVGMVFLIACGAILALKELSESTDSIGRYEMLRKIGADESDISKSLFAQTGIFFLLPLLLACIHSVFGMKYAYFFLDFFGTEKIIQSVTLTSLILLFIYGGYFLVTYFCSKSIIKEKR